MVNLLLVVGGLLFAIFIAELILPFTIRVPEIGRLEIGRFRISKNPKIGIEPIPFSRDKTKHYNFKRGQTGMPGAFNRFGFRDKEPSLVSNAKFRIIAIGDWR